MDRVVTVCIVIGLVNLFAEKLAEFIAGVFGLISCAAVCYAINTDMVTNFKQVVAVSIIAGFLGGIVTLPLLPFYRKTNRD